MGQVGQVGQAGQRLVLATQNSHKVQELQALLHALAPELAARLMLVSLAELGIAGEVVEDGATFGENALIKARAAHAQTGLWALADDSGLEVTALHGAPGVHSARYGGEPRSDARNLTALLGALAEVPAAQRGARFVCTLALYGQDGAAPTARLCSGECRGSLLFAPAGAHGFGYDPIFVPDASELGAAGLGAAGLAGRTYAELSAAQKNQLSHRTRAVQAMLPVLRALGAGAPLPAC